MKLYITYQVLDFKGHHEPFTPHPGFINNTSCSGMTGKITNVFVSGSYTHSKNYIKSLTKVKRYWLRGIINWGHHDLLDEHLQGKYVYPNYKTDTPLLRHNELFGTGKAPADVSGNFFEMMSPMEVGREILTGNMGKDGSRIPEETWVIEGHRIRRKNVDLYNFMNNLQKYNGYDNRTEMQKNGNICQICNSDE